MAEQNQASDSSLHLVSTRIADTAQKKLESSDWHRCQACGGEYEGAALKDGTCVYCAARKRDAQARVSSFFANRARLLEMANSEFIVESNNRHGYEAAKRFNPSVENLYLYSLPHGDHSGAGVGKTTLAAKIIKRWLEQGFTVAFETFKDWLDELRALKSEDEVREVRRLAEAQLLVLDDLGLEPITGTGYTERTFYSIINKRWLANRNGLIITSNRTLDDLVSNHLKDDRVGSRLGGMFGNNIIEISGRDWRQPE